MLKRSPGLPERRSCAGLYGIVLVSLLCWGPFFPHLFNDITTDAPATARVGQTFAISGTSFHSAAERVNLYLLGYPNPVGYAVVGTNPPYDFTFEIAVSKDGLSLRGVTFYSGSTTGVSFHFYVASNERAYNKSPLVTVRIQG
jgi:hypothetical protein